MIKANNLTKEYKIGKIKYVALKGLDIEIKKSEILVILGPSGSGKTTLLNVLSLLDRPDSGGIYYNEKKISKYRDRRATKFRKENVSFIFQSYNLLENLSVYENVKVGFKLSKHPFNIDEVLDTVGLTTHKEKHIFQLSGGEQQRVSIARSVVKNPNIMFCDEPTGALDEETGKKVLEALVNVNVNFGTTLVIVTHNPGIALMGDRIIKMNSGKIVSETINKRVKPKDIPWG